MSQLSITFLHHTVSEIQAGQTFPAARPPAHPDTMGENNDQTALKACGVKNKTTAAVFISRRRSNTGELREI